MARWSCLVALIIVVSAGAAPANASAQTVRATNRESHVAIAATGGLLLAVGYAGAVITTLVVGSRTVWDLCDGCPVGFFRPLPNWPVGLIPFIHPFGAIDANAYGDFREVFLAATIPSMALELAGLLVLAFGFSNERGPPRGTTARVTPTRFAIEF